MKHIFKYFACLLVAVFCLGQVWAESCTLTSAQIKDGSGSTSYGNCSATDGCSKTWNAYAIKNQHSNATSSENFWQIKKYASNTAYYIQVPDMEGNISSIAIAVSSTSKPKTGGGNNATLYFSASNSTSSTGTNVASGTGTSTVTIDCSALKLKGGYITASAAVRIWEILVTYSGGGTTNPTVSVEQVTLDESSITLEIDDTQQLTATVSPDNASNKNVTWESSDEDVAIVEDGLVTAIGAGDAIITCKSVADETKAATCSVHVNTSPYTKSSLVFTQKYSEGGATADDGAEWTVTSNGTESNFDSSSGIHYGTNNAEVTYVQLVTSEISGEVAKVVVNARDAQACANITVLVGSTSFTCSGSATATNTSSDYTFTGSGSGEIIVRVDRASSKTKAIYVKSVVVSYIADNKQPAGLAYDEADKKKFAKLDDAFTAPTLTNPHNLAVNYASSNTNVATVASNGAVTIKATGTTEITASYDGDDDYKAGSASYTIVVTSHAGTESDPYNVADAKIIINALGTKENAYVSGIISQIDSYSDQYHSITYWISDDGTTTDQLEAYSGKGIDGANFSSINELALKDIVVVKGTLKLHNSTYEFDYNNQLVSLEKPAEPIVSLKQSGSVLTALNVDATNVANQAIDIVYDNFENEISSVSAKLYEESTCETEITSGAWVTDITVNGAKDQVTFNVADNAGEARQVWLKVTASDGTNSPFAVLNIKQAKYTVDYAELPFAFDGGRADIATTNGMTQEGLDSDYGSSPKLKFNGTDDVVIIKINADPGTLTYDIKNNSFSGGTFTVQQSADGVNYTNVEEYTTIEGTQNESKTLAQTTRYVKFIYTEKVNGNVALGNIAISEYVAPAVKPTITTQPEGAEYEQNYTAEALTIVAEAGNSGALSYQWYSNSSESTEGAEAIEGAIEDEYTPSTENIGTVYYYCVVTEAGADEKATSSIVAVVVSAAPEPTGTFELFSGDLVEGDYVIYYEGYAMKNVIANNRFSYLEVTPSNDKIENPDEAIIWHIAASGDYWTLYNAAVEKYASTTSSNNQGALADDTSDDKALWSVTGSGTYEFVNKGRASVNNKYLRNNGTYGFAVYASGTGGTLSLYKKSDGKPAAPTFSPAGGSFLEAQSVTISAATGASIYYTTDGSTTPTTSSTLYTGAIAVSTTTTIKAIAVKDAVSSNVTTATYTIVTTEHAGTEADPYSVSDAMIVIDAMGTKEDAYVSGIISQVDSYSDKYKSITYWISDDGTTTDQLEVYSGKGIDGADFSSINDVALKDIVVVKGTLKKHNDTYEFDYDNQLVSLDKPAEPIVALKQSGSAVATLNVEATDIANQAIDIVCTNFGSAISSVSAKLYGESSCETEITSGAWVTDITVNEAKTQLTFNIADNDGAARQVWMKVTASDGTDAAYAVLAISQAKYTVDYATLPFAFNGGKNDIANTNGLTQSGLGSDYSSDPKLKFDNTSDYLIIRINEAPDKLAYSIKNNGFSGGKFTIQESVDGETYTEVASHTEIENTQSEEVDLNQATRYVKFIYTEKSSGNVGLGNITISKYENPEEPDYTRDVTPGNYGTICLPNGGRIEGAAIFEIAYFNAGESKIFFDELESNIMVAGRPYIFWPKNGASRLEVYYTDNANAAAGSWRGLHGSYSKEELTANDGNYILYQNMYYLVNSEAYVGVNRAYIKLGSGEDCAPTTAEAPAPGRRRVAMGVQGKEVATGILDVEAGDQPMKIMIDNQLYIIRAGHMYDMTGNKVK